MNQRRADGELWGCRHFPKNVGGAGGSEEIGDGVGAGTGSKVDGVGVEVGDDAGVRFDEGSKGIRSVGVGAEVSCRRNQMCQSHGQEK